MGIVTSVDPLKVKRMVRGKKARKGERERDGGSGGSSQTTTNADH